MPTSFGLRWSAVVLAFVCASCTNASSCPVGPERDGPYTRVTVTGDTSALGIIDPSVAYAQDASSGLMTYTAVPSLDGVHIAIADSTDHGATWRYVADVTDSAPITITTTDDSICGAASCAGKLVYESSSLIVDPSDPNPGHRLKVFAHAYFFNTDRHLEIGYIAMDTASTPQGPWTETKLFGWDSSSPLSNTGVAYDVSTDPGLTGLHDCVIVGEPGAVVRPSGTIDLALSCPVAYNDGTSTVDIRLLRSDDHGATWTFVATMLTPDDATALGATSKEINGADLFFAGGTYHLIATPTGPVDFPGGTDDGYRGCVVVPVEDLDAGTVSRCGGEPIVEASYLGQPGQFVGACSADVGASADGMLIPVPDLNASVPFQLFASKLPIP